MARGVGEKDSSKKRGELGEKKSLRIIEVEMVVILVSRFKTEMSTISNQLVTNLLFGQKILTLRAPNS